MRANGATLGAVVGVAALCGAAFAGERAETRDAPDPRGEAKVELGRRLFFDPAASAFGRTSCASCHDPAHGFSDPERLSRDETGPTPRHSQGLLDLAESPGGFHWDGEFGDLRELVTSRLGTPAEISSGATRRLAEHLESALAEEAPVDRDRLVREFPRALTASGPYGSAVTPSGGPTTTPSVRATTPSSSAAGTVARRLERDGLYDDAFARAFGDRRIDTPRVAEALEAYLLTLRSTESRFDRWMDGDERALGPEAKRGFELFAGKAGCATCHTVPVPGKARAFSDFAYHNTGVAYAGPADRPGARSPRRRRMRDVDAGRGRVTVRTAHEGRFKTPSLRDVASRAPYMHDGRFATLEEVVRYYDAGGTPNEHLDPAIRELDLTDREVGDLVAFLESLSCEERPGLGALPERRSDDVQLRIVALDGKPLRRFTFRVRPVGDHFVGADALPDPFEVTTDRNGYARFPFPASTHVALDAPGHELGEGRLLPDTTERLSLVATPHDTVSVVVRKGDGLKRLPSELFVAPLDGTPAQTPGRTVTFRRERTLGDGRVLYTAPIEEVLHFADCRTARLSVTVGGVLGDFDFDASGGATEEIDLRDRQRSTGTASREGHRLQGRLFAAFTEVMKDFVASGPRELDPGDVPVR